MNPLHRILLVAKQSSEALMAVVMVAIVGALIVPLPPWLLDLGIGTNLAVCAAILVAAIYAKNPLRLTSFPTLLLLTTLLRLGLNVSSTRLALAEGHAGEIIQAFGEFVVRGEYVVGAVVFLILVVVQFLVVTKGAERVAEVSARFTLDSMPGKQMAIDADLRSGAIDQTQAKLRRHALERESQMFGSMDGAMKFIKGDVIAGLIIVCVNLIGGTAIGVLQHSLSWVDAASTYALISIGDGLVSQVSSLCIAIAAGLVVTRVSGENEESSVGSDIAVQLFGYWKALYVVGGVCAALGCLPGMPKTIFFGLALLFCLFAYRARSRAPEIFSPQTELGASKRPPNFANSECLSEPMSPGVLPLVLDLSGELSSFTQEEGGCFMTEELKQFREQIYLELGIQLPSIRVRTHAGYLPPHGYALLMDEVPCAQGQLANDCLYVLVPTSDIARLEITAEPWVDVSDGRPVSKISVSERARAELAQVPFRTPRQMLLRHMGKVCRKKAAAMLGIQDVQQLVESFESQAPALVKAALEKVPLPLLTEVLRKLLREEVSIRNLRAILEALVAPTTAGDADALAERCRQTLRRYLSHKYAPSGPLYAYLVDPEIEQVLREGGPELAVEPAHVSAILEGIRKIAVAGRAVLLASSDVRRTLRRLSEVAFPDVAVLTFGELDADLQVRPIGKVSAELARQ